MKIKIAFFLSSLLLAFGAVVAVHSQAIQIPNSNPVNNKKKEKPRPKELELIKYLVNAVNEPGAHSEGDVYLKVKIGGIEYLAELLSGKVLRHKDVAGTGGGICGKYAEVSINLLNQHQLETSQGAGQILKFEKEKWRTVALSEGDYACQKLNGIPTSVITCLKIECN